MSRKIMIIEDEPDIREYLVAVLEDNGYHPIGLSEADSAADAARRLAPDLILIDIMMPVRSGISIYLELRLAPDLARIPIALMSGIEGGSDLLAEGLRHRAGRETVAPPDGFIEKPIRRDALLALVRELFV